MSVAPFLSIDDILRGKDTISVVPSLKLRSDLYIVLFILVFLRCRSPNHAQLFLASPVSALDTHWPTTAPLAPASQIFPAYKIQAILSSCFWNPQTLLSCQDLTSSTSNRSVLLPTAPPTSHSSATPPQDLIERHTPAKSSSVLLASHLDELLVPAGA